MFICGGEQILQFENRWTISAELPIAVSHTYGTHEVSILTAGALFSVRPADHRSARIAMSKRGAHAGRPFECKVPALESRTTGTQLLRRTGQP
jgi:hypothetical protein